mmetsp:Transcript_122370/g.345906  ORF Transcript_122370/g.345906 Transcript_122370/m.345906 type:complete len:240 (-) Transcript_122370:610-1329(-)
MESRAKSAKNHVRNATECAAAAKPLASKLVTVRVNSNSTACSESVRTSCEKLPTRRGRSSASANGHVRAALHLTSPRCVSSTQNTPHASHTAKAVANAAPWMPMAGTPRGSTPKTSTASSIRLANVWTATTRSGVAVSSCPRRAPTATVFIRLAGRAPARMVRYDAATAPKLDPGSAPASCRTKGADHTRANHVTAPRNAARPITRPVISLGSGASGSPRACATAACATSGTVTTQRKL